MNQVWWSVILPASKTLRLHLDFNHHTEQPHVSGLRADHVEITDQETTP